MAVQAPLLQDGPRATPLFSTHPVPTLSPSSSFSDIPQVDFAYESTKTVLGVELLGTLVTTTLLGSTAESVSQIVSSEVDSGPDPTCSAHLNDGCVAVSDTSSPFTPGSVIQQMKARARATIVFLSSLIAYVSVNSFVRAVNPSAFIWCEEDKEEDQWMASSHSWFDRKACRWLGLCGLAHYRRADGWHGHGTSDNLTQTYAAVDEDLDWRHSWTSGTERPELWNRKEHRLRHIPDYVLEYAPVVHLYSDEQFWPCDIAEHLKHVTPHLNYTPVQASWDHPTLRDLDKLNNWDRGRYVFLTSNDDVESRPAWLEGRQNIPVPVKTTVGDQQHGLDDESKDLKSLEHEHIVDGVDSLRMQDNNYPDGSDPEMDEMSQTEARLRLGLSEEEVFRDNRRVSGAGRSDAPVVLIVVDKGDGIVDAFWFYFYSFNLGNVVFNIRFGNHVGDWEHSLVRFQHGIPKAVYFSEHSFGEAYSYEAVEKLGKRPVIYSAEGSHAMYANPGTHAYILPLGLLYDKTDRGPLWDPVLNYHSYTYDVANDTLRASNLTPHAPTEWFYYSGHWGDKFYPLGDSRQYRFAGQYHYVNGPIGPRFKNLGRRHICQGGEDKPCVIRDSLEQKPKAKRWLYMGEGEEMSEDDCAHLLRD